jgi:hypothetical protein
MDKVLLKKLWNITWKIMKAQNKKFGLQEIATIIYRTYFDPFQLNAH